MRRMKIKKGYTLIEMLIVVAIVGILASLAFANIQSYRNKAQKYACITNLRTIESNMSLWAINNGKNAEDQVTMADLVPKHLMTTPYCPLDAAKEGYILGKVSEKPTCPRDPENHRID